MRHIYMRNGLFWESRLRDAVVALAAGRCGQVDVVRESTLNFSASLPGLTRRNIKKDDVFAFLLMAFFYSESTISALRKLLEDFSEVLLDAHSRKIQIFDAADDDLKQEIALTIRDIDRSRPIITDANKPDAEALTPVTNFEKIRLDFDHCRVLGTKIEHNVLPEWRELYSLNVFLRDSVTSSVKLCLLFYLRSQRGMATARELAEQIERTEEWVSEMKSTDFYQNLLLVDGEFVEKDYWKEATGDCNLFPPAIDIKWTP